MKELNLSKEQAIKYHRQMWMWIAKIVKNVNSLTDNFINEVARLSNEYFDIYGLKRYYIVHILHIDEDACILNNCFLCDYAYDVAIQNTYPVHVPYCCKYCPLDWGIPYECGCMCGDDDGLYAKVQDEFEYGLAENFSDIVDIQDIYETCIKIANLKEIL